MTQTPLEWFLQTVESNQGLYQLVLNSDSKVYYRDLYRVNKEDYQFIYDTLLNNKSTLSELQPKSKIYAPKVNTVTSDRFKQFLKEKQLVKTDNINDADAIIINRENFSSPDVSTLYFTSHSRHMMRGGTYISKPTAEHLEILKSTFNVECTVEKERILVNSEGHTAVYFHNIVNFERQERDTYEFISTEGIELFHSAVVRGIPIIDERQLSSEIVKGTVIDETAFESLKAMLTSSDPENHIVARKILYECDVDASLYYIWQLTKLGGAFYRMHENRSKLGKAFVQNARLYHIQNCSPSKFLDVLKDKEILTQETFEKFKDDLIEQQRKIIKHSGVGRYLHIEFKLTDELAEYTEENPMQLLTIKKEESEE